MTDASMPSPGTPRDILAGLDDLTRKVRAAQRGTWFPLLLFGVVTLGAILVNRLTFSSHTAPCPGIPGTVGNAPDVCKDVRAGSPLYAALAPALAYIATAIFYVRHARDRGVGSPVRPYVVTGLGLVALETAIFFWNTRHGLPSPGESINYLGLHLDPSTTSARFVQWLSGQPATIGIPLLVLSWVERNRGLLIFSLAYLAIELVVGLPLVRLETIGPLVGTPWMSVPRLAVSGVFLLLGALGFSRAERSGRCDGA